MPRDLDRRQFVALISAAGAGLALPQGATVLPRVETETSVLWRQPDGRETLVRFFISGADAPAARLRVFDSQGRFLGTAGAIRIAQGQLYGELWLPLRGPSRISVELALPGARPIRSSHSLVPKPKWSIYWITVLSPKALQARLGSLPRFRQSVEWALLRRRRVALNPLPAEPEELGLLDHLEFVRCLEPAAESASRLGIELSRVAVARRFQSAPPGLALLLRDSGVMFAVATEEVEPPAYWLEGPAGARVLVVPTLGSGGAGALDFPRGGDPMKAAVERWLGALAVAHPSPEPMALLVDRTLEEQPEASLRNVEAWNQLYAYPRIVVGEAEEFFRRLVAAVPISNRPGEAKSDFDPPSVSRVSGVAEARDRARQRRTEALIAALAQALGLGREELAGKSLFPLPGWLVFNPSPFTRSDLVEVGEGVFRLVTDVPGAGYVYLPDLGVDRSASWAADEAAGDEALVLENQRFRVRLSRETGGIQSVRDRASGFEWVSSRGELNAIPAARLERAVRYQLGGLASRLWVSRWSPGRGTVETTVTVYRHQGWIDVENRAEASGEGAVPYRFDFAVTRPELVWETPLGTATGAGGSERIAALRWIRLSAAERRAYLSAIDAPLVSVGEDQGLIFWGPRGRSRFRLGLIAGADLAGDDEAWRFGWSIENFVAIPVAGGGDLGLPRWGSLFSLGEPGVAVLGVEPAGPGETVVYLQELLGVSRQLRLGPGVLTFESATVLDLSGKALESADADPAAGVTVSLPPRGVAAVRLRGVVLART